jgi:hypothetical protein
MAISFSYLISSLRNVHLHNSKSALNYFFKDTAILEKCRAISVRVKRGDRSHQTNDSDNFRDWCSFRKQWLILCDFLKKKDVDINPFDVSDDMKSLIRAHYDKHFYSYCLLRSKSTSDSGLFLDFLKEQHLDDVDINEIALKKLKNIEHLNMSDVI